MFLHCSQFFESLRPMRPRSCLQERPVFDHRRTKHQGCHRAVPCRACFHGTVDPSPCRITYTFKDHGFTEDDIFKLIFTRQKGGTFWHDVGESITLKATFYGMPLNEHWSWIARSVPMRPIKNVFVHVRRAWERTAIQGRWSDHEDEGLDK